MVLFRDKIELNRMTTYVKLTFNSYPKKRWTRRFNSTNITNTKVCKDVWMFRCLFIFETNKATEFKYNFTLM